MAAGTDDQQPLGFLEKPDYDEAFGPPDPEGWLEKVWRDIWASLRK